MKRMASLFLAIVLLTGLTGGAWARESDEMENAAQAFSLSLFEEALDTDDVNVVISPISAYLALSMAALGASGDTLSEFADVLGVEAEELAAYCAKLMDVLTQTRENTKISIGNSGWIDEVFNMDQAYLARISSEMNAEAFIRDLDTDQTREEINAWVSNATSGLIPTLLDENLSEQTVLALENTLYFKGVWRDKFAAYETRERPFHREDGTAVDVQFMNEYGRYREYISAEGVEGVLRPYDDGKTAFIALRATDGRSARALARTLTPESLSGYIASATETYMTLSLPRFMLEYGMLMNDALTALGLERAFDPNLAEFDRMGKSPFGSIYVSRVLQKVRIEVDEEGTEAAAATIVDMAEGSAMPMEQPVELILDSPFVYAVVDLDTGTPLFIGCMEDPSLSVTSAEAFQPRGQSPKLTVRLGDQAMSALRGSMTLDRSDSEGNSVSITTDTAHPLDYKEVMPALVRVEGAAYAELIFEIEPDIASVRRWEEKYWEDAASYEANFETVTLYKDALIMLGEEEPGYIYEVNAQWTSQPDFRCDARYSFFIGGSK